MLHPLPDGGHIRVASVAGRVDQAVFERGVDRLARRGFQVSWNGEVLDTGHPYLASADATRAAELTQAFEDPDSHAVVCARGGYGSLRLVGRFDPVRLATTRKPFAGYSDITALHLALNRAGLPTFHAPVVTALGGASEADGERAAAELVGALQGRLGQAAELAGTPVGASGEASGALVGGNLSLLAACLPIQVLRPPPASILLIEEVSEPLYRIDRMLTGLKLAGLLDEVAAVALGSFAACGTGHRGPVDASEVAAECLYELGVPVVAGLPIGHRHTDRVVPLGTPASLDPDGHLSVAWPTLLRRES